MDTSILPPAPPKGEESEGKRINEPKLFEFTQVPKRSIQPLKLVQIYHQTNLIIYLVIPFVISLAVGALIAYGYLRYTLDRSERSNDGEVKSSSVNH